MIDADCGMFGEQHVELLLNDAATTDSIWRSLAALRRKAAAGDTVWVYYAGHAAIEDGSTYWVTHDADVDDLFATGLSGERVAQVLGQIGAERQLVLLDCCHAAAMALQKNPSRAVVQAEELFETFHGRGNVTLCSSDGTQRSVELGDQGHGAFTYYLERGLRGEADLDGDGVVTADELWRYLQSKVADASREAGIQQTPVLMGQMTHELALTLNPVALGERRRLAEAVEGAIGLGEGRLSTEQALFCLEMVRRGPGAGVEGDLYVELIQLANDGTVSRALPHLIDAARREPSPPGSEPVLPESKAATQHPPSPRPPDALHVPKTAPDQAALDPGSTRETELDSVQTRLADLEQEIKAHASPQEVASYVIVWTVLGPLAFAILTASAEEDSSATFGFLMICSFLATLVGLPFLPFWLKTWGRCREAAELQRYVRVLQDRGSDCP